MPEKQAELLSATLEHLREHWRDCASEPHYHARRATLQCADQLESLISAARALEQRVSAPAHEQMKAAVAAYINASESGSSCYQEYEAMKALVKEAGGGTKNQ
jgi:hypothetical protein